MSNASCASFERTSSNSQPNTFEADSKVHGGEAGVRYVYPSGTSMAYRFRDGKGEYPGRVLSPVSAGNFTDREHEFRFDWAPTAKTTLRAKAAYVSHEITRDQYGQTVREIKLRYE